MKRCPVCQSTYSDDSLRFCLQDGTTLEGVSDSDDYKTLVLPEGAMGRELPPTEVLPAEATARAHQPPATSPQRARDTDPVTVQEASSQPKTRSTASVVSLTALATILLIALGGLSAWLLLKDRGNTPQRNDNAGNLNAPRGDNQNNTPPPSNANATQNANVVTTPTPTAKMTAQEKQVRAALNSWLKSFNAHDLNTYLEHYPETLDVYYLARNVPFERVRADKQRAFAKYSTLQVSLSNIKVEVDPSGERAVATFIKTYRFSGTDVDPYEGSGANRFTWEKINDQWYIVGEEDISR